MFGPYYSTIKRRLGQHRVCLRQLWVKDLQPKSVLSVPVRFQGFLSVSVSSRVPRLFRSCSRVSCWFESRSGQLQSVLVCSSLVWSNPPFQLKTPLVLRLWVRSKLLLLWRPEVASSGRGICHNPALWCACAIALSCSAHVDYQTSALLTTSGSSISRKVLLWNGPASIQFSVFSCLFLWFGCLCFQYGLFPL